MLTIRQNLILLMLLSSRFCELWLLEAWAEWVCGWVIRLMMNWPLRSKIFHFNWGGIFFSPLSEFGVLIWSRKRACSRCYVPYRTHIIKPSHNHCMNALQTHHTDHSFMYCNSAEPKNLSTRCFTTCTDCLFYLPQSLQLTSQYVYVHKVSISRATKFSSDPGPHKHSFCGCSQDLVIPGILYFV